MSNIDFSKLRTVEIKHQELINSMRLQRDDKLREFDVEIYRNPIYWDSLTDIQRTERLAYRQLLLDITTQVGFPSNIVWPTKPEV